MAPETNPEVTPASIREQIEGSLPDDLGIEALEVNEERAVGRPVVDRRHLHPGGYVHGGAWLALADSIPAWGTFRNLPPPGHDFTTIELKLNVFAAAGPGEELVATAEPHHVGRRTQVWQVRVDRERPQVGLFTVTQMVLAPDGG